MTENDRILEYLDGELSATDEAGLFKSLGEDAELRSEFRHHVQISQAVRADREAFTPPADVERKLLGGLGLLPVGAAGGAAAGGAAAGGLFSLAALKSGLMPMLVGFLLGALLVGGGVMLATDGDEGERFADGGGESTTLAVASDSPGAGGQDVSTIESTDGGDIQGSNDRTVGSSHSDERVASNGADASARTDLLAAMPAVVPVPVVEERVVYRDRTVYVSERADERRMQAITSPSTDNETSNPESLSINAAAARDASAPIETDDLDDLSRQFDDASKARPSSSSSDLEARSPRVEVPELPSSTTSASGPGITLELRKGVAVSPVIDNSAREVPSEFITGFFDEEIVGGIRYGDAGAASVGIEVGRERYAQTFYYNREDSLVIEQRPLVTWAGVTGRLPIEPLGLPVEIGGTLGASAQGGPMARGLIAVDILGAIAPSAAQGPLRVPVSAEVSSLVYRFEDQYLVSGNWGFNIGAEFRFGF